MVVPITLNFNVGASRNSWDELIKRYGNLALLRRAGMPDRWVAYMQAQFTAAERLGGVTNPVDRKALISAISPDTGLPLDPEPSQFDTLITLKLNPDGTPQLDGNGNPIQDERLSIFAPPGRVGPSRQQLYWRLQVRS